MPDIIAYIDESGNTNLNTEVKDVSQYFVLTAIILHEENAELVEEKIGEIRRKYFSGSEIKSSGVRRNIKRRIDVLKEINAINFTSHIIAINKNSLKKTGGFIYKSPFLKFTNGLLYRKLFRSFQKISIYYDQSGYPEFQASFRKYLEENHRQDLFRSSEAIPMDSKLVNGIQIADMIAGSTREILEYGKNKEIYNLIKEKSSLIEIWPPKRDYFSDRVPATENPQYDDSVEEYCVRQAKAYIERTLESKNEEDVFKLRIVESLLALYYSEAEGEYVTTKELIEELSKYSDAEEKSEYYARTKIADLRVDDVIIASSAKGLKIPTTVADLKKYVEENRKKIIPMIKLLAQARNQIKLATMQQVDILESDEKIKRIVDDFEIGETLN